MTDAAHGLDPDPGTEARLGFLMSRSAHGSDPAAARLIETHMSWVIVAGERVLKMKKPVRYPFLDFSTPQLRERNCREELRLNRRLAPQVYLGLLALQWHEGRFALLPEDRLPAPGITIDWLVLMRRLPDERMLDHVIAAGALHPADIDAVVRLLSAFYRGAARTALGPDAYVARFRREQAVNRELLLEPRFAALDAGIALDRLDAAIDAQAGALRERVLCGKVVDGHGDLRPEHVCLNHPPVVIDCLEFSAELRQVDPFDELAFLGLECTIAGVAWVAQRLVDGVGAALDDRPPDALVHLYAANRAALRARLAVAHLQDPQPRTPERWLPLGRRYLAQAASALDALDALDRAADAQE
jgi:aminoglycoside phosphotransferase family enzyme